MITQKYEVEVNRKMQTYEQNIGNLTRENEEMKRVIIEL